MIKKYSQYKGVSWVSVNGHDYWTASSSIVGEYKWIKNCKSEREAALAYDKKMLELGREPVNILVRKK